MFLHHYCVHLAGPDRDTARDGFPGDRRAARGFNGDIARHRSRWWAAVPTADAATLGRRVARKTLLAVAGLVSVHDATWTTDRDQAARRWSEIDPELAPGLAGLLRWSERSAIADRRDVAERLTDTIDPIVEQFAARIGLWPD